MNLETRQLLEADGFQVVETAWDFKYKTRTFLLHPDGRLNPYYDFLHEIPMLPNGMQFDLNKNAMPTDPFYGHTAVKDAGSVNNVEYEMGMNGLPIPVIVGYMFIAVILLAIVICIYYIINPPVQEPPCGTEAKIIDISECAKIIIMPNCDSRTYNSCKDEWMEEDWHTWEPPANWGTYLVLGLIGIGAIIIIPKVLDIVKPPKSK